MVSRRGKVVYFEAVGNRDVEADKPMERDTICRFYSMAKPITSVAVMMLVEAGKLRLEDAVSKHVPELKGLNVFVKSGEDGPELEDVKREITVRDLLTHTSGLTYGYFGTTYVDQLYRTAKVLDYQRSVKEMIGKLQKLPLLYQPGTKWTYSVSVDVLGHLVEVVSGKRLDAFLQQRVFGPLDMHDSGFYVPKEKLDRFAKTYGPTLTAGLTALDNRETNRFSAPPVLVSGGGGLVSTARDYMRFCQMLLGKGELDGMRLLRRETVEMMTSNQLPEALLPISFGPVKREGLGFGLGVSVRMAEAESAPGGRVGEYGWGGAACTHFWISPRDELIVVVLAQYMPFSLQLENAVKPIVYGALIEPNRD
jgi:CubicO group peptidase (beta-lactamase class C family)